MLHHEAVMAVSVFGLLIWQTDSLSFSVQQAYKEQNFTAVGSAQGESINTYAKYIKIYRIQNYHIKCNA